MKNLTFPQPVVDASFGSLIVVAVALEITVEYSIDFVVFVDLADSIVVEALYCPEILDKYTNMKRNALLQMVLLIIITCIIDGIFPDANGIPPGPTFDCIPP